MKSNGQLDFSNPESVKQLTKSLLEKDFGLKIELPDDRLCPPAGTPPRLSKVVFSNYPKVPNRLNYLLWIQYILDTTSDSYSDVFDPKRPVIGLDIGTGASCIYPLLGCSQRLEWRFAGTGMSSPLLWRLALILITDIDDKSLQFARQNVQINGLQNRIKLHRSKHGGPLLPLDDLGFEKYDYKPVLNSSLNISSIDFSMCNPPFYESKADMLTSAALKQRRPFTACTGSETEMVTPGGEVAFVSHMIEESIILQGRVQWYTSMLGKFSSLGTVVKILKDKGVGNYAVTEFVQGSKTRRWGVAWSFEDLRPGVDVARGVSSLPKALLPFPSQYVIMVRASLSPPLNPLTRRSSARYPTS